MKTALWLNGCGVASKGGCALPERSRVRFPCNAGTKSLQNHCGSRDQLTKAVGLESASCCRGRGGVIVCLRASKRVTTSKAQRWVGTPALVYPKG